MNNKFINIGKEIVSPVEWKHTSVGTILVPFSKKGNKNARLLSVYREYGVIPKDTREDNHNRPGNNLEEYKAIQKGDLVINKMKAWQGSLAISDYSGIVSPAYITCKVSRSIYGRFLHYLLRNTTYKDIYNSISYGVRVGQWDMRFSDFKYTPIAYPNHDEQQKIANFLDIETAKIDKEIELLEKKVELLNEYQQSLIFETVTKGLDKNVKMKDSGIEWIGEIPEHWEVKRVKDFIELLQGGSFNSSVYVESSKVTLIRMGNIKKGGKIDLSHKNIYLPESYRNDYKKYILKEDDVVISMTDMSPNLDFLGVPATLINLNKDITYMLNQRVGKLVLKSKNLNIEFLKFFLLTSLAKEQFKAKGLGTIQGNMSEEHLNGLKLFTPPKNEQQQIVEYLDEKCSNLDKKKELISKKIELLKEYKQSLIYEAVTGKLEIN